MTFAIISDIHGNIEAFDAVLDKCNELNVGKYICLGDTVGYNANPAECIDKLRGLDSAIIIKGNHDEYIGKDIPVEEINKLAEQAVLWSRSVLNKNDRTWLADLPMKFINIKEGFSVVHAALDSPESWVYLLNSKDIIKSFSHQITQVCFFGHTHLSRIFVQENAGRKGVRCEIKRISEWEDFLPDDGGVTFKLERGKKYLINVGSIGQPRDGDVRASFVIYDSKQKTIKRYAVSYDVGLAQKKILEAGLPIQLAYRLSYGR